MFETYFEETKPDRFIIACLKLSVIYKEMWKWKAGKAC